MLYRFARTESERPDCAQRPTFQENRRFSIRKKARLTFGRRLDRAQEISISGSSERHAAAIVA